MKLRFLHLISVLLLSVLVSGCSTLRQIDDKAGVLLDKIPQAEHPATEVTESAGLASSTLETSTAADAVGTPAATGTPNLTEAIKNKIDAWLEANNLNRFGDATSTMYAGGTPLFNEMTGESIDRFDYLLKKIPDLLNKIIR